jgi:hypothetical protein
MRWLLEVTPPFQLADNAPVLSLFTKRAAARHASDGTEPCLLSRIRSFVSSDFGMPAFLPVSVATIFALVSADTTCPMRVAENFAICSGDCSLPVFAAKSAARVFSDIGLPLFAADTFARTSSDTGCPILKVVLEIAITLTD